MTEAEREAALARLRDFAHQQQEAGEIADQGSLERAVDVVTLYEDKTWVRELEPPKQRRVRGRPVDPESFSRFTKWVGAPERADLKASRLYQLRDAHEMTANYFHGVEIKPVGEFSVRPLKWLRKHGHEDAIPEVWRAACEQAGGPPSEAGVKHALKEWKDTHGHRTTRAGGGSKPAFDVHAEAAKLRAELERFMHDHPIEFVELWHVIDEEARDEFNVHAAA